MADSKPVVPPECIEECVSVCQLTHRGFRSIVRKNVEVTCYKYEITDPDVVAQIVEIVMRRLT